MNINNCDILIENGRLRLIYDMPGFNFPMTLIHAYSNHELNEKAMKIFEPKEWIRYLAEQSDGKTTSQVHPLLADIYKSHQEDYMAVLNNIKDEKIEPETCDSPDYDDKLLGTVIVTATGEVDEETGHRLGRMEIDGLKKMDTDALRALADDLDIDGFDTMPRLSLIFAIHEQDIDIDDCDGDCKNCEYADLNDHDDEDKPEDSTDYEYVDGPAHYHGTECIENMRKLYGDDAVRWFCICNAYKYRFRDGSKPGVTAEQDEEKARWYENYAANMMGEQRYY